ncbi:MAG: Bacteriophage minor capsid protein [Microbacterium sp.]|jgi:hypothetical protein|nr:Bacteriophage minor capsid protein [Microbacterium sp.]
MDDVALTRAICALLGRVPGWFYDPDVETLPADRVAIFEGAIQPEPDRAIGVRCYASTDGDLLVRRVQLRLRGAPYDSTGADALAGVAFTVLHGLSRAGGISDIRRISSGPLGADTSNREERSDNYQVILDNPEALQ